MSNINSTYEKDNRIFQIACISQCYELCCHRSGDQYMLLQRYSATAPERATARCYHIASDDEL